MPSEPSAGAASPFDPSGGLTGTGTVYGTAALPGAPARANTDRAGGRGAPWGVGDDDARLVGRQLCSVNGDTAYMRTPAPPSHRLYADVPDRWFAIEPQPRVGGLKKCQCAAPALWVLIGLVAAGTTAWRRVPCFSLVCHRCSSHRSGVFLAGGWPRWSRRARMSGLRSSCRRAAPRSVGRIGLVTVAR